MKQERRWMKSALAAAQEAPVVLPWARGTRRRPASVPASTATRPAPAPKVASR